MTTPIYVPLLILLAGAAILLGVGIGRLRKRLRQTAEQVAAREARLRELENEVARLKEETEAGQRFFPAVSQQLRTPLNAIVGFSELLHATPQSPEQLAYIEAIQSASSEVLELISNVISFAKITTNQLVIQPVHFDFPQMVREVVEDCQQQARRKNVPIRLEMDFDNIITLNTDRGHLRTILQNLLNNAVRFTDAGQIVLRINKEMMAKDMGNRVFYSLLIEVEDTGIGIPAGEADRIFKPFYQVVRPGEGIRGGIGLGLAIVSRLVELLEGQLEYLPLEKGSLFRVKLTVPGVSGKLPDRDAKKPLRLDAGKPAVSPAFYALRVLVAEDSASNAKLLEVMLSKMGHKPIIAQNGQEVIRILKSREDIDVILMDIQMPLVSGDHATTMIRNGAAGAHYKDIPIVAVTAYAMTEDQQRLLRGGINYHLPKPINPDKLRATLTRIVRDYPTGGR